MYNSKFQSNTKQDDYYYAKYIKYRNKCNNLKKEVSTRGQTQLGGRRQQRGGNPNIYNKIDQVHFWLHQFEEHATIIALGIESDPDANNPTKPCNNGSNPPKNPPPYFSDASELKLRGIQLHLAIKDYLNELFVCKGIDENKIVLDQGDFNKLGTNVDSLNGKVSEASGLVQQVLEYKQLVISRIKEGEASKKWLGWIQESLVQHMIDELLFYQDIIKTGSDILNDNTDRSIEQQISFWTKINAEHVGTASKLLDIDYSNDADFRNAYENYFMAKNFIGKNRDQPTNLTAQLQEYLNTLDTIQHETKRKIDSGELKSVIHPDLAFHDVREAERAKAALPSLSGQRGQTQQQRVAQGQTQSVSQGQTQSVTQGQTQQMAQGQEQGKEQTQQMAQGQTSKYDRSQLNVEKQLYDQPFKAQSSASNLPYSMRPANQPYGETDLTSDVPLPIFGGRQYRLSETSPFN
jgi:hypothetical protein